MAMMHHDAAGYPGFPGGELCEMIGPDELNTLERVFEECREDCCFSLESERARSLGRALIRVYSRGEHNPVIVRSVLVACFKRHAH